MIGCTLGTDDLAAQAERWNALRTRAAIGRTETATGLRVRFRAEPGVEEQLRELVAVENTCCSWAKWAVEDDRTDGEIVVDITSTGDGVAVAQSMFRDA